MKKCVVGQFIVVCKYYNREFISKVRMYGKAMQLNRHYTS